MNDMNLVALVERFRNEDKCRTYLEKIRWENGLKCPRCAKKKINRIEGRDQYDCQACHYHFSVTAGTIFHDSHLPLWKWFLAIYMMAESKKGVSACQIQRTLGIGSYKTAWYLCHRIRAAMTEAQPKKLNGTVEVDEAFIGGVKRGRGRGYYLSNKAIVAGIIQRGGDLRMSVIPNTQRRTLHNFINKFADDRTKEIITDEWKSYKGIADHNTTHSTINHHKKEWVRGKVHTNTIESVWSLLKRSIVGSYHKISKKHMDAYLDELEWRYNNRKNPYLFRATVKKLIGSDNLKYQDLVAS
jgi:transposase-like protein